jgi:hypothetical protein
MKTALGVVLISAGTFFFCYFLDGLRRAVARRRSARRTER